MPAERNECVQRLRLDARVRGGTPGAKVLAMVSDRTARPGTARLATKGLLKGKPLAPVRRRQLGTRGPRQQ